MGRDTSKYVIDGVRWPSVTEVLDIVGLIDYSMVPPHILEAARNLGVRVHEWLELVDLGHMANTETPDDDIGGFIIAYDRFKQATDFRSRLVEQVVMNRMHCYVGTLDRAGQLNGKRALVDIKTVREVSEATALQTAGYAECLGEVHQRYSLQLWPDGNYRLDHYEEVSDRHVFLAAARVAHWRMRKQGVTL